LTVRVSDLAPSEFDRRLAQSGIFLHTGPFVVHLRSELTAVNEVLQLLYSHHRFSPEAGFADFHVRLDRPATLRRWIGKQVVFLLDGVPLFEPFPHRLGLPLLEWGMNWSVSSRAHQYLMIHAAVVERAGRGIILPARPGSGKSTLTAALVHRGWRLLSDEHALVRPSDGVLIPLPRPIALKNHSVPIIRHFAPNAVLGPLFHLDGNGDLLHVRPPPESVERAQEPAVPAAVVFPTYRRGSAERLKPLSKSAAFLRLADNSFNYSSLGKRGFEALSTLVDACRCFDFTYERLDDAMARFDELAGEATLKETG
jgi:hypothetical protein